ncbi:MAG TPA: translation initiation factor IF-3 [Candidatus Methylomirabilis sp.]|jgi:translation initiation factor IF-3|nr:translation initiation factor IF-3 [Candidatus Methylomirabilis sp.]
MEEVRSISRGIRINDRIRVKEVRVVGPDGVQLGILPVQEALEKAQALSLDLVEVAPLAKPPVCRIMDYGKYRYEESKKAKEAKKKQVIIQLKEIKMRPKTDEHDFNFKARHVDRFLRAGHKAKVTIMFRGREVVHTQLGKRLLDRLAETLKEIALIEQSPRLEGRNMTMILAPRPEVRRAERAAAAAGSGSAGPTGGGPGGGAAGPPPVSPKS